MAKVFLHTDILPFTHPPRWILLGVRNHLSPFDYRQCFSHATKNTDYAFELTEDNINFSGTIANEEEKIVLWLFD